MGVFWLKDLGLEISDINEIGHKSEWNKDSNSQASYGDSMEEPFSCVKLRNKWIKGR